MSSGRATSPKDRPASFGDVRNPFDSHSSDRRGSACSSPTSARSSAPMSIRSARRDVVPPPLAPPRQAETRQTPAMRDWAKRQTSSTGYGSVREGSSLAGSWKPTEERPIAPLLSHKMNWTPQTKSPLRQEGPYIKAEPEEATSLPGIAQHLQGAPALEYRNDKKSSQAYDQHQLSKFSRPKTPNRSSKAGSLDKSPLAGPNHALRLDTQNAMSKLTLTHRPFPHETHSPFKTSSPYSSPWSQNPYSGTISPSMISSTASTRSFAELRSPTSAFAPSTAASSLTAEEAMRAGRMSSPEQKYENNFSQWTTAFDEGDRAHEVVRERGSASGRSKRGSFDQGIFASEPEDSDLQGGSRRPSWEERDNNLPFSLDTNLHAMSTVAQQGVKRKASPSLSEPVHDDKSLQAGHGRTPGRFAKRASPSHQPNPSATSHSSASAASLANGAPTTSAVSPPMTTSQSRASAGSHEHLSPISSQQRAPPDSYDARLSHSPYGSHTSSEAGIHTPHSQARAQQLAAQIQASAALQQEVRPDRTHHNTSTRLSGGMANIYICNCCPKKPKKFDNEDHLRQHQREKAYYCGYCNNRFKNKNEMERHQNSLHVRKQSWACAALNNDIRRAFHACTKVQQSTNPGQGPQTADERASHDICGYCGASFPNPPDWEARNHHIIHVHKFGECNQTKKFFRADHFRQHLKHSHAGQSGKWTNMLEAECVMQETPDLTLVEQEQLRLQELEQGQQGPEGQVRTLPMHPAAQAQAAQALHAAQIHQHQQQQQGGTPNLTAYQVQQLRSAPVANMMGGIGQMSAGPYPALDVQYDKIEEVNEPQP